jgi:hypothetical protein
MTKFTTNWIKDYDIAYEKYSVKDGILLARAYSFGKFYYARGRVVDLNLEVFHTMEEVKIYCDKLLIKNGYAIIPDKLKILL